MVEPGEIIGIFPGLCRWIKEKRPLSCYRTKTALIDFTIFSLLGSRIMCLTSLRIFRGILVETATKWSLPGRVMDNLIASWKSLSNGNNRSTNPPIKRPYEYPVKDEGSQSMTTLNRLFLWDNQLISSPDYCFNILWMPGVWFQFAPQAANRIFHCIGAKMLLCIPGRSIELIPCKHSSGAFRQTIEHGIFAMI